VLRVQRRRASRTSDAPAERVQTETVVRRTTRDADGNYVKTTQRDKALNPLIDERPRPVSSAEMAALLRSQKALPAPQAAAPAALEGD